LDFLAVFADLTGKWFSLLWRGSRDGFGAREFHGHANTLTVILNRKGNVFGGFTPLEWESREGNQEAGKQDNCIKADGSLRSFVFTLKNPHNLRARRFALRPGQKSQVIYCHS
jgi:hypothetical protein